MKFLFRKEQLGQAPEMWLRQAGYIFLPNRKGGQDSFARPLTRDFYPRFHLYFTINKNSNNQEIVIFNLHLDQKKPGYAGVKRHNAEYEGELVSREVARLKSLVLPDFLK